MVHHDCDREKSSKCKNIISKLELFKTGDGKRIFSEETLIKDSESNMGKAWGLDYSYSKKRLFFSDIEQESLR